MVEVIAVKPADRGTGIVVRLRNWGAGGPPRTTALSLAEKLRAEIKESWRANSNERDINALPVRDGVARLTIDRYLTTVWLTVRRFVPAN